MTSRNIPVFVGGFLSGIFLLVGVIGTFAVGPKLLRWRDAALWTRTPAEIVEARIVSTNSARGGRTLRPHFVWTYEVSGGRKTGEGFGVASISTTNRAFAEAMLTKYPPGAKVEVLVNPRNATDSILERDPATHLIVLFVPPLFALLGVISTFFTLTGWLGWYGRDSRNPLGRLIRSAFSPLLRPAVLMAITIAAFVLVCGGLVWWSVATENYLVAVLAFFLVWGLRKAMQKHSSGRSRKQSR